MTTGRIREQYYPDYLSPEEEIEKSNLLNEQQTKTIMDKSLWREYTPRLLPASPYMMSFRELGWASEAINELIRENKDNKKLYGKLAVISTIVVKERQRKERQKKYVFLNRN